MEMTTSAPTSASPPSSPAEGGYPLAGPSDLPDPATHAYRDDLADIALAGRVIASHYAEPLTLVLSQPTELLASDSDDADVIATMKKGEQVRLLDIGRGWGWGYGPDGQVGYMRASALPITT